MFGILAKKLGQTRVYDESGTAVCVTVVQAGPCRVIQCKTPETDGYQAVQLGFEEQKERRVNKPLLGHFKKFGVPPFKYVRELRGFSLEVKPGDTVGADIFEKGDFVDAIGITKGRGFQGVVKRHGFGGGPSSHGSKGWHRRPGAIGQRSFPGTVRRGARMPGHMGQVRRTVQNLEVVQVRPDDNVLLIKGAIPGAKGDYVILRESKKMPRALRKAKEEARRKAEEEAGKKKKR